MIMCRGVHGLSALCSLSAHLTHGAMRDQRKCAKVQGRFMLPPRCPLLSSGVISGTGHALNADMLALIEWHDKDIVTV